MNQNFVENRFASHLTLEHERVSVKSHILGTYEELQRLHLSVLLKRKLLPSNGRQIWNQSACMRCAETVCILKNPKTMIEAITIPSGPIRRSQLHS